MSDPNGIWDQITRGQWRGQIKVCPECGRVGNLIEITPHATNCPRESKQLIIEVAQLWREGPDEPWRVPRIGGPALVIKDNP